MILLNAFSFLSGSQSIFGIIWLIVLILVFRNIWSDDSRNETNKLLWSLVVFFFPVGGVIIWWLFSKK